MSSVNKVILIGNVGQDPEIRYLPLGEAVANLSLATSESWKDKSGVKQERTEWHKVCVFGKLAEIVGEYVKAGKKIYIEGKLQTRKWKDKDGADRYSTEIKVDSFDGKMVMLGGKQEPTYDSKPSPQAQSTPAPEPDINFDDSIPF